MGCWDRTAPRGREREEERRCNRERQCGREGKHEWSEGSHDGRRGREREGQEAGEARADKEQLS